jgi:transposase InsO family protein
MELAAKRRRHKPMGTLRRPGAPVVPNLLGREFEAQAPTSKWVSDTTHVWTMEGWLYVAVMLEVFSRLLVGWAMSQHNDEQLVRHALEMARVWSAIRFTHGKRPVRPSLSTSNVFTTGFAAIPRWAM